MMDTNYVVVADTPEKLVIKDCGPWDKFLTVTNGAESVVEELSDRLGSRRLFYYDSEGDYGELVVKEGRFLRFAFAKP